MSSDVECETHDDRMGEAQDAFFVLIHRLEKAGLITGWHDAVDPVDPITLHWNPNYEGPGGAEQTFFSLCRYLDRMFCEEIPIEVPELEVIQRMAEAMKTEDYLKYAGLGPEFFDADSSSPDCLVEDLEHRRFAIQVYGVLVRLESLGAITGSAVKECSDGRRRLILDWTSPYMGVPGGEAEFLELARLIACVSKDLPLGKVEQRTWLAVADDITQGRWRKEEDVVG